MTLSSQIESVGGDPAGLERLYRQAVTDGNENAFKKAIEQAAGKRPEDVLFAAWTYRLDVRPAPGLITEGRTINHSQTRRWSIAIATSVVLGVVSALLARGKPPIPVPGEANPLFWIGWAPLVALGIFVYLAIVDGSRKRTYRYVAMAVAVVSIAFYAANSVWNRIDDIAILSALHLPLVSFGAIGAALMTVYPDPAKQCYAFLVKSAETVLTGGIYFAAGIMFVGLTCGIFAVLGITPPDDYVQAAAAWGIGAIPVMAIASVYDPTVRPAAQDWTTGLSRILRILTQLILPLALAVLVIYEFWFVPAYFWKPFQEREVLIVYNATILAILVLLTVVVSGSVEERSSLDNTVLRYAVMALGGLTLLLNVYALVAIASRIYELGLTPNRYAVFGWNTVTLLMIVVVGTQLWRRRSDPWVDVFRESIARVSLLAVAWATWTILGLPLTFD
jgi:hypothetical protein